MNQLFAVSKARQTLMTFSNQVSQGLLGLVTGCKFLDWSLTE